MDKLKVINLFSGPGSGKSTTRADLFCQMKKQRLIVEEATEYAKDLTYDKDVSRLSDQLYILAKQNRKLERLKGKVEWVVTDSPILLSYNYATADYLPNTFKHLVFELWDNYENYNFFLKRDKPYFAYGRNQTEDEAKLIDTRIYDMLINHNLFFTTIKGNESAAKNIMLNMEFIGENE